MRGIRIDFGESGPRFNFTQPLRGFDATVQNALVNVGTARGSDPVFLDRGTDLKLDGAQGRMATTVWADHSANFAALRTLSFIRANDQPANSWRLQSFRLRCERMRLSSAVLAAQAVSAGGTTVGVLAEI